jgi:hypothetical protein
MSLHFCEKCKVGWILAASLFLQPFSTHLPTLPDWHLAEYPHYIQLRLDSKTHTRTLSSIHWLYNALSHCIQKVVQREGGGEEEVKLSLLSAMEAYRFERRRGSHIIQTAQRFWWGCQPYVPATLYPQEDSWYTFPYSVAGNIWSVQKSNYLIGNQTSNLLACGRASTNYVTACNCIQRWQIY